MREIAAGYERVLVCLDSNHTHDHVLAELEAYAPLTRSAATASSSTPSSRTCPPGLYPDRPWGPGDNPKTAVREYLKAHTRVRGRRTFDAQAADHRGAGRLPEEGGLRSPGHPPNRSCKRWRRAP